MSLLDATALSFHRQGRRVFAPVDIHLDAGCCLIVTGVNGAGKTTLLRLLAGITRPAEGRLRRAPCAFLGHRPGLKADLTCLENLNFARTLAHQRHRADARALLARVGLAGLALRPARTLSAGQARRLALARVIMTRAPLWLLDEPYASLDNAGGALVDELLAIHLQQGGGVVLSTHQRQPVISTPGHLHLAGTAKC